MIGYQEARFETFDRLSLYAQWWYPEDSPKAIVVIIHGSFEHSSRYQHVALYLVSHGYAVYAFDLRGHGKSEGERAFIPSFEVLVKDLESFLDFLKRRDSTKPVFLLGHSSGGCIALFFEIIRRPTGIKGMVLSATALKMKKGIGFFARSIAFAAGYFFPRLKLHRLDSRFLSHDQQAVSSYNNDPLIYREGLLAGTVLGFLHSVNKICSQLDKIDLPLLILHGGQDQTVDISGSKLLYDKSRSPDKTFKVYQNCYHELFNEPDKELVLKDVVFWLDAHISKI